MDHDRCCDSKIQKAHVTDKSTFGAQLLVLEAQEAFLLLGGLLGSMGLEANRAARGIETTVLVDQRRHVFAQACPYQETLLLAQSYPLHKHQHNKQCSARSFDSCIQQATNVVQRAHFHNSQYSTASTRIMPLAVMSIRLKS
mgnify:CR=1 FL=1